jgi:hypothetical protein
MSEPKPSRSQQKRIAAQTKAPDRFAAVKRCLNAIDPLCDRLPDADQSCINQARAEIKQAEERLAELEGIDLACDAANEHVKLLLEREVKWRELLAAAQECCMSKRLNEAIAAITEGKS